MAMKSALADRDAASRRAKKKAATSAALCSVCLRRLYHEYRCISRKISATPNAESNTSNLPTTRTSGEAFTMAFRAS